MSFEKQVKAKKCRDCTWCGDIIAVNSYYWKWVSFTPFVTHSMHDECFNAHNGREDYTPFKHSRPDDCMSC